MALRDSIVGAIQSGQMAVGSTLTGGGAAVASSGSGAVPLLEDLRGISRENETNTENLVNVLRDMFSFDKEKFARMRDQSREVRKEKLDAKIAANAQGGGMPSGEEITGGFGVKGLAAIAGLAFFAKELGANTDILKLPQQLKSLRAMANFAKGIGVIGTLGFGPQIIDSVKDTVKMFGTNVSAAFTKNIGDPILNKFRNWKADFVKKTPFAGITSTFDEAIKGVKTFFDKPIFKTMKSSLDEAAKTVKATMGSVIAVFKGGGGGPAGASGTPGLFADDGPLKAIVKPLKAIGRLIGKLFLPITVILGIFDGYTGFMEEYEKDQSVADGIKGAVVGIVDGFIGSFVRLATSAIAAGLEFLGLDALATTIDDFGTDITDKFSTAVGGLVDFVTGIFTLDLERITKGLTNLVGGTADFIFRTVTIPVDMAIAFVQDLFNLGDPENPFSIYDFFMGEDGVVPKAVEWFTGLFSFDFKGKLGALKDKIFDMGKTFKAIVAASAAAVKAGFPGGESPGEAYKRVFEEMTAGNNETINMPDNDANDIVKTTATDVEGNTTETTYKTETINNAGDMNNGGQTVILNDQSAKDNSTKVTKVENSYPPMDVGIDPYFDRLSLYG